MSQRPSWRFMLGHPARLIALGFGSGLAPFAPGTFGTAWAWATYVLAERFLAPVAWADALFELQPGDAIDWRHGFGNLLDDFVAAGATLLTWALALTLWRQV